MRKWKNSVDRNEGSPTIRTVHPFSNVHSDQYWWSTPAILKPTGKGMYCLGFYGGSIMGSDRNETYYETREASGHNL
jgi:hypothetical protein